MGEDRYADHDAAQQRDFDTLGVIDLIATWCDDPETGCYSLWNHQTTVEGERGKVLVYRHRIIFNAPVAPQIVDRLVERGFGADEIDRHTIEWED